MNNTGIVIKCFYKVPRGFEFPFAGRWLRAVGHNKGCIHFVAASGRFLSLGNASAELLAKNAASVRITTPSSWL